MLYAFLESFGKFYIISGFIFSILESIIVIFKPEFMGHSNYTFEITIALGCLMVLVSKLDDIYKTLKEIKEKLR